MSFPMTGARVSGILRFHALVSIGTIIGHQRPFWQYGCLVQTGLGQLQTVDNNDNNSAALIGARTYYAMLT